MGETSLYKGVPHRLINPKLNSAVLGEVGGDRQEFVPCCEQKGQAAASMTRSLAHVRMT